MSEQAKDTAAGAGTALREDGAIGTLSCRIANKRSLIACRRIAIQG